MTRTKVIRRRLELIAAALMLWASAAMLAGIPTAAAGVKEATQAQPPAEATQDPAQESPQVPVQPETIRLGDIPSRAEVALALSAEVRTSLAPSQSIVSIEAEFPGAVLEMDAAYADFEALDLNLVSTRRVRDLSQIWTRYKTSLTSAQESLVPRRESLQASGLELGDTLALWERTRDSLVDTELPEGIGERITSVIDSLQTARQDLEARLAALLTLETRVSEQLQRANEVLQQLSGAESTARQRLLDRDSSPLWSLSSEGSGLSLLAEATDSYYGSSEAVQQFLTAEIDGFVLHVALFLVFVLILAFLRRWSLSWDVDSGYLERAKFVLSRPIAVATLLSLLLTHLIYEAVPDVVNELTLILTLLPILRLVSGIFSAAVRPGIYAFLGLFFFGHILSLIPEDSLLFRLVLMLVALAGIATLIWFLRRPPWPDQDQLTPGWRATRRCLQLGTVLLGISAIANLLGWLRLSGVLLGGTFYSAYAAILAYALWATLSGIIAALPYTPISNRLRSLDRHGQLITRRASSVVALFCLFLWVRFVARAFDIYDPLYGGLASVLQSSVAVGSLSISLGKVITVVLILWLARLVSRLTRFVLQEEVFQRLGWDVGESEAAATLVHYVIGAIAIVGVAAALGVTGTQIAVLIGALGVGIGFGLQTIVNNFISGLILIFERPIKVGDMVEVGTLFGKVQHIGIRASIVRTFEGAEVVVPNADLISKEVTNWTLSDQVRRRELSLGVAYGTPPEHVIEILADVVKNHPKTLDEPEPMILFQGFVEGTMRFSLRYWVPISGSIVVASEVAVAANAALRAAGIRIPVPQREIVVRKADDDTGQDPPELPDELASLG